jgi:hypothetical protein
MLSADIFASVTIKELYLGVRRREFKARPCKASTEVAAAFGRRHNMVTNSWHGRRKGSLIFLSLAHRNTANFKKRQSLTPYKSLPLAIHSDHSTLQPAPQTDAFIRPLLLIAHFR